ncbi:uncharacterized protein LOC119457356 [Dermacentor silvarum]|uniref:uncharacterized protein LOC119457356 n=1 Tax=Dermacentor silvarum TaxID=543639 RepID=UPI001898E0F7|nr:uncharacterized protein LOC119457356 [Dermacentor silvarum]
MARFARLSLAGPPVLLRAVIGGLVLLVVSESVTSMPTKSTPEWRRISDEAYFSDLLYPCSDDLPQVQPAGPPTDTFAIEYVKILGERTTACLGHASKLLAVNLPESCSTLQDVMEAPDQVTLQSLSQAQALSSLYGFLVSHAAYAFFVSEQAEKYANSSCASPNEHTLAENSRTLAAQLRDLLCTIKLTASVHGGNVQFSASEERVASLRVCDESTCSRRLLRDCQVVASVANVLRTLQRYLMGLQPDEAS